MKAVIDSSAALAYVFGEEGGEVAREVILDKEILCLMHAINACEVFYDVKRRADEKAAQDVIQALTLAGLEIREDMDAAFWQDAGRIKARGRIALADCFAVVLARREGAELVTADRHELRGVQGEGLCKVRFIR